MLRKMRLVPADDVRVKILNSKLAGERQLFAHKNQEIQTSNEIGTQTVVASSASNNTQDQMNDAFTQSETLNNQQQRYTQPRSASMTDAFTQSETPETLNELLIRRYSRHVDAAIHFLRNKQFSWTADLTFRNPPDVDVVPVIEHITSQRLKSLSPQVLQFYRLLTTTSRQVAHSSPPKTRKRASDSETPSRVSTPTSEGKRLVKKSKLQLEKHMKEFDQALRGPFNQ